MRRTNVACHGRPPPPARSIACPLLVRSPLAAARPGALCLPAARVQGWPLCAAPQAQVEGISLDEESLSFLGEIGEETSLRHAVQVGDLLLLGRMSCWVG